VWTIGEQTHTQTHTHTHTHRHAGVRRRITENMFSCTLYTECHTHTHTQTDTQVYVEGYTKTQNKQTKDKYTRTHTHTHTHTHKTHTLVYGEDGSDAVLIIIYMGINYLLGKLLFTGVRRG
jgi:hypothetical protein